MRQRLQTFTAIALMLALSAMARAHDVQAARAAIDLSDGRWTLTLTWDLAAHIAQVSAGHIPLEEAEKIVTATDDELRKEIDAGAEMIREGVKLHFDGRPVEIGEVRMPTPDDLRRATVSTGPLGLIVSATTGEVPSGASFLQASFPAELGAVVLTITVPNAPALHQILSDGQASWRIPLRPDAVGGVALPTGVVTSLQYIYVGFRHILPDGIDHVLFVLGLFLLSARMRPLLWQVTAFTVAHSVTLALAMLEIMRVPGEIVEPLIAASIAYVAIENIATQRLTPWRPAIVFAFGLLHGLGFAGALHEWGLPDGQFANALISFNVGVELGQLAVIGLAFLAVGWFRNKPWYRAIVVIPASVAIAVVALYWTVTRIIGA